MNSLLAVNPYKKDGLWAIDDELRELTREPLVLGIDSMLDYWDKKLNANNKLKVVFSNNAFPKYNFHLEWLREESGGNWYYSKDLKEEGWLCPALYKYFEIAPKEIFMNIAK